MKYFIFSLIVTLVGQAHAQDVWARVSARNLKCDIYFATPGHAVFAIEQLHLGPSKTLFRIEGRTDDTTFMADVRQKVSLCNASLAQIAADAGFMETQLLMVNITTGATEPVGGLFVKQPSQSN